jgi:hypothetical protein
MRHIAVSETSSAPGLVKGRVRGILPGTDLFQIMMAAYGWE